MNQSITATIHGGVPPTVNPELAAAQYRRHRVYLDYLAAWRHLATARINDAARRGDAALYRTVEQECQLVVLLQAGIIPALLDHLPQCRVVIAHHRRKIHIAASLYRAITANN